MSQLQMNSKYKAQAGITLIEVLISMLLTAIIGLGGAYIASRTAVIQRNGNIQIQSINKMRQIAVKADTTTCRNIIANPSTITIGGITVKTPCTLNTATYTVNSFSAAPTGTNTWPAGTSVASADVTVTSPSIEVDSADTFVPVKSVISP